MPEGYERTTITLRSQIQEPEYTSSPFGHTHALDWRHRGRAVVPTEAKFEAVGNRPELIEAISAYRSRVMVLVWSSPAAEASSLYRYVPLATGAPASFAPSHVSR